ncbi:hypothetical protein [Parasitella parasitica]|uniref:Uncharacterized protein n=1 Tax=Parasitella parasitica TaxID=35722 RepID=A0A0B7N804_9FUNG|nr:hypothetical protein [Parasitella parasitica]
MFTDYKIFSFLEDTENKEEPVEKSTDAQPAADKLYARHIQKLYNEEFSQEKQRDRGGIIYDEVLARQLHEQLNESAADPSRPLTSTTTCNTDSDVLILDQDTDFDKYEGDGKPPTGILNTFHESVEVDEEFGMDDNNDFVEALSSTPIPDSMPNSTTKNTKRGRENDKDDDSRQTAPKRDVIRSWINEDKQVPVFPSPPVHYDSESISSFDPLWRPSSRGIMGSRNFSLKNLPPPLLAVSASSRAGYLCNAKLSSDINKSFI